jgi:uncharacterized delta-60 repeat protein
MRLFRVRPTVGLTVVAVVVAATVAAGSWPAAASAAETPAAASSAGSIDTSFGNDGYSILPLGTWVAAAGDVIQPDGKIVSAGEAEIDGVDELVVTRMDSDGDLDRSFGNDGVVIVNPPGGAGMDSGAGITLQPDGKIVVAGTARFQGTGPLAMAAFRFLPDGTPDPSFGIDGIALVPLGLEAIANAVVVAPDGKILLDGDALIGHTEFAAARLNADGTPDTSFGTGGVTTISNPEGAAWGMVLEQDGKILLGGEQDTASSKNLMAVQLQPNGALDDSFASNGILQLSIGSWSQATAVALQPDGRIILAGGAITPGGDVGVAIRLLPDGSYDPSFGSAGIATFPDYTVNAIELDSSGRIVIAGVGATAGRLEPDGSVDESFGDNGIAHATLGTDNAANGLAIDPSSGDIVLAGVATISGRQELAVVRLTAGGSAGPASGSGGGEPASGRKSSTHSKPKRRDVHKRRTRRHVKHKRHVQRKRHKRRRKRGRGSARKRRR